MMKQFLKITIIFSPLLVLAQKQPEIVFPSAVEVSPRSKITAFDVVETRYLTEELADELKAVEIGTEKTTRVEKSDLIQKLHHLKAKFILPSEMKLLRSRHAISRMELERKIKNQLTKDCGSCDLQIQISSVPLNVSADWELDLNVDLTKSSMMIPIQSISQNEKKGWIVGQIKRYQQVPVLNRPIKMGDVITADLLATEKRQILNSRETVAQFEHVIGMQAVRYLSAGQVLSYSDLKKEQIVKRGQIVKAIYGHAFFDVSIAAQVEEAGSVGDVIKIKNMDSLKVVAARVVEKGLVRIE